MKTKILVIFLVMVSLFMAGCAENGQDESEMGELAGEVSEGPITETGEPQDHLVRMEYYEVMVPSELDIDRGDSVAWHNFKQQGSFILVSDDRLFEETELLYRHSHSYTFNKSGTYTFHAKDLPHMNITVNVA